MRASAVLTLDSNFKPVLNLVGSTMLYTVRGLLKLHLSSALLLADSDRLQRS